MSHQCLICESTAVINQNTARTITLFVAALNGFVRGWQTHQPLAARDNEDPVAWFLQHLSGVVSSAAAEWSTHAAFVQDMEKYQFGGFDCLCLRCGALFDTPPEDRSSLQSSG